MLNLHEKADAGIYSTRDTNTHVDYTSNYDVDLDIMAPNIHSVTDEFPAYARFGRRIHRPFQPRSERTKNKDDDGSSFQGASHTT